MKPFPLLAALVAISASAQTVYSWEDKDGVHYTDDPSQVPKRVKTQKAALEAQRSSTGVGVSAGGAPLATQNTSPTLPGGADERTWRERFISATRRITQLRQSIDALYATLPSPTVCSTSAQVNGTGLIVGGTANTVAACGPSTLYARMKAEIAQKEVEFTNAQVDLQQLDRQASYDGVPREWRRGW